MALKLTCPKGEVAGSGLAVPFPGAMALKPLKLHLTLLYLTTCSPLPRGDGAETRCKREKSRSHIDILQSPSPGRWR